MDQMESPDTANQEPATTTACVDTPWNLWYDIYVEEWGEEETKRRLANQFQFPAAGMFSSLWLQLQVLKLKIAFGMFAKNTKKRPSHPLGVGASGTAKVLDAIPVTTEFFSPGRTFQVRLRHGNFRQFEDDACLDGRSVAVWFADEETGDRLDLLMNTGSVNFFQNIPTFIKMLEMAKETKEDIIRKEVFDRPINLQGTIAYIRRAPESYTMIHYYALLTYILVLTDGGKRYVRFRVIPEDVVNNVESGLPSKADQQRPWDNSRTKDETRSTTYLRDGYKEEVSKRNIKYFLDIQVHDGEVPGDPQLFNSSVAWDEEKYPWQHMMEIVITTPMSDEECENIGFNLKNRPSSLILPHPESVWDYNSIGYAREQVYDTTQAKRATPKANVVASPSATAQA